MLISSQSLDREKKGFLTPEELKSFLTSRGDLFNDEEVEEMLHSAVDPIEGNVDYYSYAKKLAAA